MERQSRTSPVAALARSDARAVARALAAAIVVGGLVTFAVAAWWRQGRPGQVLWVDVGVYAAVYAGAALLMCTHRSPDRRVRRGWRWLGVALLSSIAANTLFSLVVTRSPDPPYPSVADVFYLAWYPCSYVGIILLLRAGAGRTPAGRALDGAIAGLGAAAVAVALVYDGLLTIGDASPAQALVNLAYPVGDLLLVLLLVAGGVVVGGRPTWSGLLLVTGLCVLTGADLVYLLQDSAGTYAEGGWADLLWLVGVAAMAAAECVPGDLAARGRERVEGLAVSSPPVVFGLLSVAVIAAQQAGWVSLQAVVPADAALLAAVARTVQRRRELHRLEAREVAELRRLARTDALTGLANWRSLVEQHELLRGGPQGAGACLLMIGIDGFRQINNSLGHVLGDELLRQVGQRLLTVAPSRSPARIGGDEFAVLTPGTVVEGQILAARIRSALTQPFRLGAVHVHIDVRVGLVDALREGGDTAELVRLAGLAMSRAAQERHRIRVYETDDDDLRHRFRLTEQLRAALHGEEPDRNGTLVVHVQPQVRLAGIVAGDGTGDGTGDGDGAPVTGAPVVGAEALARWLHPADGLLMPRDFLPLAATAGLLPRLADVVLDAALGACRGWWDAARPIPVSVNLTASDLLDVTMPQRIGAALHRHRLPPSALVVELTEDGLLSNPDQARAVISAVRASGVAVSIDDYGTGYSSLAYLQDLPVDELKLDQVFTRRLAEEPSSAHAAAIVRTTADLAHSLGLRLVAEGIEHESTARQLAGLGVDVGQGYHVAPPMPSDRFAEWLAARSGASAPAGQVRG